MKHNNFSKKRIIHACIVLFSFIMILIIAGLCMLKYSIEGEKNLPFNLKNISIVSTAESDIEQDDEENWHAGILQKNDILLVIEKNEKYKKRETIKEIKIENFQIKKEKEDSIINVYRPKSNELVYIYSDEYKIQNSLEYKGALETNIDNLEINNQGCKIGFSITQENLGEYKFSKNEKVPSDGKLLSKAGLKNEDIKFIISFDLIIETGSGNKFKSKITLNLPTGNILDEGVSISENSKLEGIIFKRIR